MSVQYEISWCRQRTYRRIRRAHPQLSKAEARRVAIMWTLDMLTAHLRRAYGEDVYEESNGNFGWWTPRPLLGKTRPRIGAVIDIPPGEHDTVASVVRAREYTRS